MTRDGSRVDDQLPPRTIRLVAYVAGTSSRTVRTLRALHTLADAYPDVALELEVVDVLDHPTRADRDRIIATPTLIRVEPLPSVRLVGDLSEAAQTEDIAAMLFDR